MYDCILIHAINAAIFQSNSNNIYTYTQTHAQTHLPILLDFRFKKLLVGGGCNEISNSIRTSDSPHCSLSTNVNFSLLSPLLNRSHPQRLHFKAKIYFQIRLFAFHFHYFPFHSPLLITRDVKTDLFNERFIRYR